MKLLARVASSRLALLTTVDLIFILGAFTVVNGAQFFCSSGNVTCLIAAINQANKHAGADTINLDPGIYTLTSSVNFNGLPIITSHITINGDDAATTIIERDPDAPGFRIFSVAVSGKLTLNGLAGGWRPWSISGRGDFERRESHY